MQSTRNDSANSDNPGDGATGTTGATSATSATGTTGPAFNSYLNAMKTADQAGIPVDGIITLDVVMITGTDLTYDGAVFVDGISVSSTIDMLIGTMNVYAATAGDTFGFINGSDGPIDIVASGAPGPIGTVSVFRIS